MLLITSSYPLSPDRPWNAGVLARDLALSLSDRGYQVWVLTPRKDQPIHDPQIPVLEIPWLGGYRELAPQPVNALNLVRFASLLLSGIIFTHRTVRILRPHICLALWAIPSGAFAYAVWRREGIPYGVWALGSDIWGRHRYPFGEAIVRHVLGNALFRLADGQRLASEVEQLASRPCGFLPSARRLPMEVPPASLPPARWHLLYVGRFEHQKGVDLLIEALGNLRGELEGVRVHMFGDGSLRHWVEGRLHFYNLQGMVHLYGYASPKDVVAMMKAVDYLLIPSRQESIPMVFGDAMQCGLPVIATDVGDLGLLVRRGRVGWVIREPSVEAIASGLRSALAHPDQLQVFRSNTANFKLWFDPDHIADALVCLIEGERDERSLSVELLGMLGGV
ncbi:glycosyltransferase [Thermoflexus sp.]|uniref:glycosyltransferase n=1 Tax=Thermoflexus sp. TaxID=1969742 RepID=UPI0035E3F840